MKTLTKADVLRVAITLMAVNGTTTSHEVKKQLRAEDFFAKQSEVSKLLAEIASEDSWDRTYAVDHCVYSIPDPNAASPSQQLLMANQAAVSQPDPNVAAVIPAANVQDAVNQVIP